MTTTTDANRLRTADIRRIVNDVERRTGRRAEVRELPNGRWEFVGDVGGEVADLARQALRSRQP